MPGKYAAENCIYSYPKAAWIWLWFHWQMIWTRNYSVHSHAACQVMGGTPVSETIPVLSFKSLWIQDLASTTLVEYMLLPASGEFIIVRILYIYIHTVYIYIYMHTHPHHDVAVFVIPCICTCTVYINPITLLGWLDDWMVYPHFMCIYIYVAQAA